MRPLVVKLTTDQPEKVAAALTSAVTAVSLGAPVHFWLAGEAVWLAVAGRAPNVTLPFAPDCDESLAMLPDVIVCSQCAARRHLTDEDLRTGARIGGAAEFVALILSDGAQALVY